MAQEAGTRYLSGVRIIHLAVSGGPETWTDLDWRFLYQLLPSLTSVLLLLLGSRFTTSALKERVGNINGWEDTDKTFAMNVAVDWSVILGVHTAMISAVVSVWVTCSQPQNHFLAAAGSFIVGFVWYVLAQVISVPEMGELVENRPYGRAFWCNFAIGAVNALIVVIFCMNNGDCSVAAGVLWKSLTN
jgi:hypothetical protein